MTARAHSSRPKIVFCAIWTEVDSGSSGSYIASAINRILNEVFNFKSKCETLRTEIK